MQLLPIGISFGGRPSCATADLIGVAPARVTMPTRHIAIQPVASLTFVIGFILVVLVIMGLIWCIYIARPQHAEGGASEPLLPRSAASARNAEDIRKRSIRLFGSG